MSDPIDMSELTVGHIDDPKGTIYDARSTKRASAIRFHAGERGLDFSEVKCTTSYARWLTKQEQWEYNGMERWEDVWEPGSGEDPDEVPDAPDVAPEDWEPDEYAPVWEFCKPDALDAVKVYCCEPRFPA